MKHLPTTRTGIFRPFRSIQFGIQFVATIVSGRTLAVDPRWSARLHHRAVDLHDTTVNAVQIWSIGLRYGCCADWQVVSTSSTIFGPDALVFFLIGLSKRFAGPRSAVAEIRLS